MLMSIEAAMSPNQPVVSYLRVSTARQGRSGLGLEAQREAVSEFLGADAARLLQEFLEVESGRNSSRPQLERALALCRLRKAVLIVAKLDRLARDAHFLLGLERAGVEFACCDIPGATRFTVGVMAMVAEEEARMISARTKAALAAAKRRGVRLGRPNLTGRARRMGTMASIERRRAQAAQRAVDLAPTVRELQAAGAASLQAIAEGLNERGLTASRGGPWSPTQVSRLLSRI
ncbi:MAG: recombinase family protein [Gemmatimonadales bacterium]